MWYHNGVKGAAPYTSLWRTISCLHFAFCILNYTAAAAQTPAPSVVAVEVSQEDEPVKDPLVLSLLQTRPGMPLSIADVRESITHLISLTRYEDVQVYEDPVPGGVRLRYVLVPVHTVDRLERFDLFAAVRRLQLLEPSRLDEHVAFERPDRVVVGLEARLQPRAEPENTPCKRL